MELVERYVAAVQRELPEQKREEIGRELQANIMDQLDALGAQQGALKEADIADVLMQMGHPRTVAQQFAPSQPLVSSAYTPLYQHALFMVLGILFLLQVAQSTTVWLSSSQMGLVDYLSGLFRGFVGDALTGFAAVTLIFWVMSRQRPHQPGGAETDWRPEQLPKAGPGWQHITLQDIFTDLATYVFLLIVIVYPLSLSQEQLANSGFILSHSAQQILLWGSPLVLLGIASSLWQLRQRIWTRRTLVFNVLLNTGFVAVILLLAADSPILKIEHNVWRGVFDLARLERAAVTSLVITAMFPLWEVLRDCWRLRQLA